MVIRKLKWHSAILGILVALMMTSGVYAQDPVINNVKDAIKAGSARELSVYLGDRVDINLHGTQAKYGKVRAEGLLRDFFKKLNTNSIEIGFDGEAKGGNRKYITGKYIYNDSPHLIYILLHKSGEKYLINTISFAKE